MKIAHITIDDELFTNDELSAVITALYAYQQETRGYLDSANRRLGGHDDCCRVAKARRVDQKAQQASLELRLATINSALSRCGATS